MSKIDHAKRNLWRIPRNSEKKKLKTLHQEEKNYRKFEEKKIMRGTTRMGQLCLALSV